MMSESAPLQPPFFAVRLMDKFASAIQAFNRAYNVLDRMIQGLELGSGRRA